MAVMPPLPNGDPPSAFPLGWTIYIYAASCWAFAFPWLSGAVTIPWDAKSQFLPQMQFLARALASGDSPFWTPNVFAGWPQIADPQSLIFSPLHFLLAWLDPAPGFRAIDGVTFALLFLGGLGIILFFRDRGWHAAGALVAALAFAFGGSANARLQHTGQIISLAYFPLTLWLLARALDRGSWRAALGAGVLGGLTAIGRDQVALLALYLLAGFVVAHWLAGGSAHVRATVKPLAVTALAGSLVAAVPVAMSMLLALNSNRPQFGLFDAGGGSLHPAHLLTLVFADLYGANDPAIDFWGPPSLPWSTVLGWPGLFLAQNVGQLYAGALVIVVIALGLIRGALWAREIRFFTVAAAFMLLYALGWYTPVFAVAYELLPGVKLFRRPADATFLLGALMAILAGYLVHRWLSGTMPPATRWQRGAAIALALTAVGLAAGLAIGVGVGRAALAPIVIGLGFAVSAIGVLVVACRLGPIAASLALALFMTVDLGWHNAPNESTGLPPALYDALRPDTRNETVALLKSKLGTETSPDRRDRVELTGIGYHWPNLPLVRGFDHVFGHNPLRLKAFFDATQVGDTVAAPDQRRFSPLFPSYRSTLADLFGLRFIATGVPVEQIDTSQPPLTFLARTADAYVYENPRALPRAMMVTGWRVADFDELIRTGGWPEVDPARTVLLERAPAFSSRDGNGTVRIVRYRNTEVIVEVDAPADGFLVLNDVWHPWWRARVDGSAAEILKANVLFRAVAVPAGRHVVRFTFHPFAGAVREIAEKLRR